MSPTKARQVSPGDEVTPGGPSLKGAGKRTKTNVCPGKKKNKEREIAKKQALQRSRDSTEENL